MNELRIYTSIDDMINNKELHEDVENAFEELINEIQALFVYHVGCSTKIYIRVHIDEAN